MTFQLTERRDVLNEERSKLYSTEDQAIDYLATLLVDAYFEQKGYEQPKSERRQTGSDLLSR